MKDEFDIFLDLCTWEYMRECWLIPVKRIKEPEVDDE